MTTISDYTFNARMIFEPFYNNLYNEKTFLRCIYNMYDLLISYQFNITFFSLDK